jgi:eukaryotic-like serine/threonine-protein kinase
MHGGDFQVGELRLKLVSFGPGSAPHRRARAYLDRRDGLTGLLQRDPFLKALDEEAGFSEWVEAPLSVARYELRGPTRTVSERPTILEMLAFRRAAMRALELTDMLLLSVIAVSAGRYGALRFGVAMVGPGPQEAKNLVEQVVGQVQGMLPDGLDLSATIVPHVAGRSPRSLLD